MRDIQTSRCGSSRLTPAWPDDSACRNIHGGLNVGVSSATGCTREHVTPALAKHAAGRTDLRSVSRVNVFDLDAATRSFVCHEVLELSERPAGHHPVGVLVADFTPLPNVFQPFHPDHPGLRVFGFGNDGLAEVVVRPRNVAALPSGEPAQHLAGAAIIPGLKGGANLIAAFLELLTARPGMQSSVRCGGSVADSQVNTHRWPIDGRRVLVLDDDVDLPNVSGPDYDGGGGFLSFQRLPLVFAQDHGHVNPAVHYSQRNSFILGPVVEDPGIVINTGRSEPLRLGASRLPRRHSLRHTPDGANGKVGGELKVVPGTSVRQVVQFDVVGRAGFDSDRQDSIAGTGKGDARFGKRSGHRRGRRQFAPDCPLAHSDKYITTTSKRQSADAEILFLCRLKAAVSKDQIL